MASNSERRGNIVGILRDYGEVRVDYLANHFETSEVTIRKDLAELEAEGVLIRKYGGAILADSHRSKALDTSKASIAQKAATLIEPGARIIIDSGHTTNALLPFIGSIPNLVVMTNSLDTANALTLLSSDPTILMPGGTWDRLSESFQGHLAEKMLQEYDFDWLFIGADGLDPKRGTTTFNEFTGLSRAMAKAANNVVVMAEANKWGRKMHNLELSWQEVDFLVTDKKPNSNDLQTLNEASLKVLWH